MVTIAQYQIVKKLSSCKVDREFLRRLGNQIDSIAKEFVNQELQKNIDSMKKYLSKKEFERYKLKLKKQPKYHLTEKKKELEERYLPEYTIVGQKDFTQSYKGIESLLGEGEILPQKIERITIYLYLINKRISISLSSSDQSYLTVSANNRNWVNEQIESLINLFEGVRNLNFLFHKNLVTFPCGIVMFIILLRAFARILSIFQINMIEFLKGDIGILAIAIIIGVIVGLFNGLSLIFPYYEFNLQSNLTDRFRKSFKIFMMSVIVSVVSYGVVELIIFILKGG